VIETFLADGPHEAFRVGIQIRTSGWQFYGFHASGIENAVELVCVKRIPVMDSVFLAHEEATLTADITGDLLHPGPVRLWSDAEDLHLASGQLDGKEHHVPDEFTFDEQLNREEIAGSQHVPVALEKLLLGRLMGQIRPWIIAVLQQDVLDRGFADLVPEVDDVIVDACVAPVRMFLFKSDHQIGDFL
jgi:hypothetical protein